MRSYQLVSTFFKSMQDMENIIHTVQSLYSMCYQIMQVSPKTLYVIRETPRHFRQLYQLTSHTTFHSIITRHVSY